MNPELQVKDLGEAATLLTLGHELVRLDDSKSGTHKIFIFSDEGEAKQVFRRYRNHEIQVDAYAFFIKLSQLKKRIAEANGGR